MTNSSNYQISTTSGPSGEVYLVTREEGEWYKRSEVESHRFSSLKEVLDWALAQDAS